MNTFIDNIRIIKFYTIKFLKMMNVSVASFIVAFVALIYTVFQTYKIIEHNENSVMPIMNVYISKNEEKSVIKLQNVGTGPSIVYGVKVFKINNKEKSTEIQKWDDVVSFLKKDSSIYIENIIIKKKSEIISINEKINELENKISVTENKIHELNEIELYKKITKLEKEKIKELTLMVEKSLKEFKSTLSYYKKIIIFNEKEILSLNENLKKTLEISTKFICSDTFRKTGHGVGVERELINIPDARELISKEMNIGVDVCYCSIYDQCWTSEFLGSFKEIYDNCESFNTNNTIQC